jgi:hypothetical protein
MALPFVSFCALMPRIVPPVVVSAVSATSVPLKSVLFANVVPPAYVFDAAHGGAPVHAGS